MNKVSLFASSYSPSAIIYMIIYKSYDISIYGRLVSGYDAADVWEQQVDYHVTVPAYITLKSLNSCTFLEKFQRL